MVKMHLIEDSCIGYLFTKDNIEYYGNWYSIDQYRLTEEMLQNAQCLYIESPKNTQDVRKICQRAARLLRTDLKKQEELSDEKRLADVHALLAHTYLTENSGLNINFSQARDQQKKQIELRERILKKEPDALNTFLYGSALYDLSFILERIKSSKSGPEERRQGMEVMKQALEMACREEFEKLEEQKELEELIKERILVLLVYEMVIFEEGTFDEPDFALALERLEEAWALVADLVKNAVSSRDGLIFHMLMRVLEQAQDLYEKASQPEKAKAMLEQGLQWCKELLKERVANSAYWKEQKLQWAYDIWWLVRDISKRYIELFLLYEEDNEKEKMQEVLKEMEEFAGSKVLLELRDKIERKQNYALCQARLDDDIAQGYERLENYDKAEEFYLKALENLDQAQRKRKTYYGRRMLEENFNALLTLYEKMNQPEKAREIKARQKQVLDKLDEYEEDEDNFYDDEMFRFTLFEADLEYLESRGERAFDF